MSRITKLLAGVLATAMVATVVAVPVKADLASDAAWVQAQAAAGMH